jgi:uncharacterized protein (DUF433 family)
MAMSRSEIELLIKARDEARSVFQGLNDTLNQTRQHTQQTSETMGGLGEKTQKTGVQATATGVAFGILGDRVMRAVVSSFQEAIREANKLDSGLIGLSSVAKAFGQDAGVAKQAAQDLAKDGLMSVGDAAAGLKNLLAAGFSLPEATTLMLRFKDSAAFGRQGALEFGQAIVGATEGIKNGNSIMVDNAGVTKNLSTMLTEAGMSATDLNKASSDVNVRMAIFNGILKETNPQLGDAARYLDTAGGKQAQFNSQIDIAQQKMGKALQPALEVMLRTLTPLVQVIGDNAEVLVPLGMAAAALVGPIVAVNAAAALGITSLGGLAAGARTAASVIGAVRGFADGRAAINMLGESAGLTTANLGKMGSAAAIAGSFFIGWQIGKIINELTGLDKALGDWLSRGSQARTQALSQANANDLLAKASQIAGHEIRNLAEAEKVVTAAEAIRRGQFEKGLDAQRRRVEGELLLGRITQEQANAQLAALDAEKRAQDVKAKRMTLTQALAVQEKAFRDEVAATGYSLNELVGILKKDEVGFMVWAKQVGLSDETVKRLKDSLQQNTKATKEANTEAERQRELYAEITSAGQTTQATIDGINGAVVEAVRYYLQAGVSQEKLAQFYGLTDVQVKAVASSLDKEAEAQKKATDEAKKYQDSLELLKDTGDGWRGTLDTINGEVVEAIKYYLDAGVAQEDLARIYGLTEVQLRAVGKALQDQQRSQQITDQSISDTKELWIEYYGILAENSGRVVDRQLAEVDRWKQDQIGKLKANDQNWQAHYDAIVAVAQAKTQQIIQENDVILQAWRRLTLDELPATLSQGFTAMLTGATSFRDGFLGIWDGIKSSLRQILDDILNYFLRNFIGGLLNGAQGARGPLGGLFSGLLGGGGGGGIPGLGGGIPGLGGGGIPGLGGNGGGIGGWLGGLFGGGGGIQGGSTLAQNLGSGSALPGMGGAATAGSSLLGNLMQFGGGGLMAGMGLYQMFQGGTKNKLLGGAQTGAGIGTMIMPGVGTLIGGGIGLLAGGIASLFGGPDQQEKDGRSAARTAENTIIAQLSDTQQAEAGGERWKQVVIGVRDAYADTNREKEAGEAIVKRLWEAEKDGPEAVARVWAEISGVMAEAQAKRAQQAEQAKAEGVAQAEQDAVTANRLADAKAKLGELEAEHQRLMDSIAGEAPEEVMGVVEANTRAMADKIKAQMEDLKRQIEEELRDGAEGGADAVDGNAGKVISDFDRMGRSAEELRKWIESELGRLHFEIPVGFNVGALPLPPAGATGPSGPAYDPTQQPDLPEAAAGIYATGARGVATWFGEGGEPEVGGPASFFERIFTKLGVGGGRGGGGNLTLTLNISGVLNSGDLVRTVKEQVVPIIHQAWLDNTGGARTAAKEALGI